MFVNVLIKHTIFDTNMMKLTCKNTRTRNYKMAITGNLVTYKAAQL
jgi:hypothetical protein